jgi:rhodanese-related sulfurtransferase
MAMKIGYKQLVAEAEAEIKAYTAEEAKAKLGDENVQFIDVRDVRELRRDGKVPGAFHAPRGMLEFWVDPESPYHNDIFSSGKEFVLFCAAGLRSALATQQLQRMGLAPVAHIDGGFAAWRKAGGQIEEPEKKSG